MYCLVISMKCRLYITEGGVIIIDKAMNIFSCKQYPEGQAVPTYRQLETGEAESWLKSILDEAIQNGMESIMVKEDQLSNKLSSEFKVEKLTDNEFERINKNKIDLMIKAGFAPTEDEAINIVRNFALEVANAKLRDEASRPDLQVIQAIQALDETEKIANILESRVKEWYGLHFPELERLIDSFDAYMKFVTKIGRRERTTNQNLEEFGFTPKKIEAVLLTVEKSKGSDLRDEDMLRINGLAEEAIKISNLKDSIAKHTERTMNRIAPNLSEVAGYSIGARLIAKAGGLDKLARLPASTIQVLGAEKALFRALRTGSRPPKHGIIFQHQAIHAAPKWQRGKIARSLAAKIAIAARIDHFRGTKEDGLKDKLEERFKEIRQKYTEPPKPTRRIDWKNEDMNYNEKRKFSNHTKSNRHRRRN